MLDFFEPHGHGANRAPGMGGGNGFGILRGYAAHRFLPWHRRECDTLSHRRLTDRVGDRGSVHQREQYVWSVLLTFKVSHWLIQNRPLGVETGQYSLTGSTILQHHKLGSG